MLKENPPGPTYAHWQIMGQPKSYRYTHWTLWICAVRTCIARTSKRPHEGSSFRSRHQSAKGSTHTHTRRVGKPRANWLLETYIDAFSLVDCHTPFDINNRMHLNILAERAQAREPPFATKQWNTQHWPEDFIEFVTEYLIEAHLTVPPNSLPLLSMLNE